MVHPTTAPKDAPKTFEFVVVGGGTAGCVVAGRLAKNPRVSVLVVEAGPNNTADIPEISTPARAFELRGSEYDWGYKTTMIDRTEYTRVEKPNTRGKMLGGPSGGNYFTWVRGSASTFDDWAEYGTDEWNWENTKDSFNKSATYHDDEAIYSADLAKNSNQGSRLHISHSNLIPKIKPFRDALQKACGVQKGLFKCVSSIYKGMRSTSAVFIEGKENVTLVSSTISKNLVLENGKAVGVTVIGPDSEEYTFNAKYEVVVSQGVFESLKLLVLSGIGRKSDLEALGIKTVVDSQHVGQNLLDHPILSHVFQTKDGYGLGSHLLRAGPQKDGCITVYRKDHSGPYSSGLLELVAFPRADEWFDTSKEYREYKAQNDGVDPYGLSGQPHFEVDFVPMFSDAFQWHFSMLPQGDYRTVIVGLMRPLSRNGEVRLQSTDPADQPYINLKFFSHDLDLVALRKGVRMIDDIAMHGEGHYPWPIPRNSDEAMIPQILERAQTGFHPCGTLRLGRSIEQGVVDPKLRVCGTAGLRVINASIFPVIQDCRIQNDVYMVAEKGADYIKAEYPELFKQVGKGEYEV